jgi:chromosome partitioning protein
MIIECEKCKANYNLDESITAKSSFRVRCANCSYVFTVYKTPPQETPYLLRDEVIPPPDSSGPQKIIAISNQKGGVAKTSTCLNLGMSLSLLKYRVLMIDFDVQSNLTISLGYKNTKSFFDVLQSSTNGMTDVIQKTRYPNSWLLPSSSKMALLPQKKINGSDFGYLLRDRLNSVENRFDYILIDTPPSLEFFTLNALIASDLVIIPSQCEYLSTHGVSQVEKIIGVIKEKADKDLDYKVLITMYDQENTSSRVICEKLQNKYKGKAFNTVIGFDAKIQESQIVNMPVIHYDKKSSSAQQYLKLAEEILGASK